MGRPQCSASTQMELKDALNGFNLLGNASNFLSIRERFVYRRIMAIIKAGQSRNKKAHLCVKSNSQVDGGSDIGSNHYLGIKLIPK